MEKKPSYQIFLGILSCLVFGLLVMGSIQLSLDEDINPDLLALTPKTNTPDVQPTILPQPTFVFEPPRTPTAIPTAANTLPVPTQKSSPVQPSRTPRATFTPTQNPTLRTCPPPGGWYAITVQTGETLDTLAGTYHTDKARLIKANCLLSESILPDTVLYVPEAPASQKSACSVPTGWVYYTVLSGDTLSQIGSHVGKTVQELQTANCLGNSTSIRTGQQLYVPNSPQIASPTVVLWSTPTFAYATMDPYLYLTAYPQTPAPGSYPIETPLPTVFYTTEPYQTSNAPWPSTTPE